eukprot:TRINITY_DN4245_c0_g1_i2.p3 TRINITY_DN4245_c0_g1~~TRINITY_DN4245_c0_g1_i2.p3  ORF type:complete len:250 (-),score=26.94 TRINITY_DN4245_c0_g1_i2:111-860(-)
MFFRRQYVEPKAAQCSNVVVVDNIHLCQQVVRDLLNENEIAVDMEGINLCRIGELCIIQICGYHTPVYIFDVVTMGYSLFDQGGLASLLENQNILKVVFDGRGDNDALYHQFNVNMNGVYDVQVLYTEVFNNSTDPFLKGLSRCLSSFGEYHLSESERIRLNCIKDRGVQLFAPEQGGSYEVWKQRPLNPDLVEYAACDVRYLLQIKQQWGGSCQSHLIERASSERVTNAISANIPCKGRYKSRIDWAR